MMHDDEATKIALGLIEAFATHNTAGIAHVVAHMDEDERQLVMLKLAAFVPLRTKVGAEIEDTAEWCQWMRANLPDLVL